MCCARGVWKSRSELRGYVEKVKPEVSVKIPQDERKGDTGNRRDTEAPKVSQGKMLEVG